MYTRCAQVGVRLIMRIIRQRKMIKMNEIELFLSFARSLLRRASYLFLGFYAWCEKMIRMAVFGHYISRELKSMKVFNTCE